jgi:predicted phosphodiesterase
MASSSGVCIIQYVSDTHIELKPIRSSTHSPYPLIPVAKDLESGLPANVLVLAGDIGNLRGDYKRVLRDFLLYCSENWENVVYVPGNHEWYHSRKTHQTLEEEYKELCESIPKKNVFWLNQSMKIIKGVRFYGTMLATNLPLTGNYAILNDFSSIHTKNQLQWTTNMTLQSWNEEFSKPSHRWLTGILNEITTNEFLKDTPIVLITHFPPIRTGTSHPKYNTQSEDIKQYFANDLHDTLLRERLPKGSVVISGHTHYCYDILLDDIRYVSHQMGYQEEIEDTGFLDTYSEVLAFNINKSCNEL